MPTVMTTATISHIITNTSKDHPGAATAVPVFCDKLQFIVLTHEMQNSKCKMQN